MGRLICSPTLGPSPRMLRTPRRASDAAAAAGSSPGSEAELAARAGHEPGTFPNPVLEAKLAAALSRATDAEARAAAAEDALEGLRAGLEHEREEAQRTGLEQGRAEAAEGARAAFGEELERVRACLEALARRTGERLEHEEDAIGEAVFASLRKLLVPLLITRDGVTAVVRAVCEQLRERESLVVRLAPADHALLAGEPERLSALGGTVRLQSDPGVGLGGCIVESASGSLDGRLEVQLAKLRDAVLRARAEATEGPH